MKQPDAETAEMRAIASPCRSGCKTRDHASYAECLKACNVQIGKLR